jgi:quercetin dioxygenase-like cupin family protein
MYSADVSGGGRRGARLDDGRSHNEVAKSVLIGLERYSTMMTTAPLQASTTPIDSFSIMGVQIIPKVAAKETNGQFSMVEETVEPGAGSPTAIGRNETTIFYVADGQFEFLVGNLTRRAGAGDAVVVPAGAIHNFKNVGHSRGRLFATFTPSGHEDFLREMSELFQDEMVRPEELQALCERYGVELIG